MDHVKFWVVLKLYSKIHDIATFFYAKTQKD